MGIELTSSGLIWILWGLVAFFANRATLLGLLIFASIFQANMVLGLAYGETTFPIIPYYWVSILIVARLFLDLLTGRFTGVPRGLALAVLFFILFGLYALISILVLPYLFSGLPVYDPREGIDIQYMNPSPLQFSLSMLGQTGLLWLNIFTLLWVAVYQSKRRYEVEKLFKWLQWSGAVAVGIALWHFVARYLSIPFPYELLHNVVGWSLGYEQVLEGVKRVSGSFTEPSSLATFLLGFVIFLLDLGFSKRGSLGLRLLFIVSLIALLLTTSTIAYVGLVVIGVLYFFAPLVRKGVLSRRGLTVLVLVLGLLLVAGVSSLFWKPVGTVIQGSVLEKVYSESFVHRLAADVRAVAILFETAGLGVGLGGNRPSSFFTWLLSNVGIPGLLLFTVGILFTVRMAARIACYESEDQRGRCSLASAATWGLVGTLIAKFIAQPDLSFPSLWVWLVLLTALASVPEARGRNF